MSDEKRTIYHAMRELKDARSQAKMWNDMASSLKDEILEWMDENGKDKISDHKYELSRKEISKRTLSKKDCPVEMWNKYSKESIYSMISIKDIITGKKIEE